VTRVRDPIFIRTDTMWRGMPADRPNVVVIFTDDQGYGDVGCFGAPHIRTPNLDAMATRGARYTNFYVGAPVCTPSRAALMTGCYPGRVGLADGVLFPGDEEGLNPEEETVADLLSGAGYATGCFGKWHLGDREPFLPTDHGFDTYLGLPYSNDMRAAPDKPHPPLPLIEGTETVEESPDQRLLTRRYTEAATDFIAAHAGEEPFFCYLPHTMPHVPLYASESFEGESRRGLYGDVIEEIDWSVGEVIRTLREQGVEEDTLVVFTSDNGPWLIKEERGGDAGPLRGGKATVWEGGLRVPCIAQWPGEIPAGSVCDELVTAMDLLPTLCEVAGADRPEREIDGLDVRDLLADPENGTTPREAFHYVTSDGDLGAVRNAAGWKYHREHDALYHLGRDVGEERDRSAERPDVVEALRRRAAAFEAELEDDARPVGRID
jgi:arylsulfatase A-like enzyme